MGKYLKFDKLSLLKKCKYIGNASMGKLQETLP